MIRVWGVHVHDFTLTCTCSRSMHTVPAGTTTVDRFLFHNSRCVVPARFKVLKVESYRVLQLQHAQYT